MRHRPADLLTLHLAVLLFGLAGLFGKWLALSPLLIVLCRSAIAAVVLAFVVRAWPGARSPFTWSFAGNGVVLAVHWIAFFAAIQASDVATGLLGFATFPLFVLAIERFVGETSLTARQWAAALLAMAGIGLIVPAFPLAGSMVAGLGLGVLSAATFAVLAVLGRRQSASHHPISIALWQDAWAAVVLAPVALAWLGQATSAPIDIGFREVGLLLVLGIACTAFAHSLFIASLGRVGSPMASVTATLEPVYGIGLAFLLLGEVPSMRVLAGGAVILAASVLATTSRGTGR